MFAISFIGLVIRE